MIIDEIHIVFENVEVIKVPYKDVNFISMGKIAESISDNNILNEPNFEFKLRKRAESLYLKIKNKKEYHRVLEYSDITHIDFMSKGESVSYIGIEWAEGSNNHSNVGQKVAVQENDITITVDQKDITKE